MSRSEHSLRKLDSAFVIPVGTQVVLRTSRPMLGTEAFKPAGSVGVVVESPPHNSAPYTVQFTDGQAVQAMSAEFSLRRREIDDLLGEWNFDPSPFVIYRCQVGSRAFGLATDASDDDIRGVVAP